MVTIALDALGGDHSPGPEVLGAIEAVAEHDNIRVILVGDEAIVQAEAAKHCSTLPSRIEIRHAPERVTMEDTVATARHKPKSSMRIGCRLVRDGEAHGFVSAGNTGVIMATARSVQGMIPGVQRPALASAFPTITGNPTIMCDVGANVDCTPKMLAQFALMGDVYGRVVFHMDNPRIGLLSIGEEEHKGNTLTRETSHLLRSLPLNFIGNVEGRDLYQGSAEVIICDGFIGNVALKVSEGLVEMVNRLLRESLQKTLVRQLGYKLSEGAFRDFKKRVDYAEYGGAPLLGVKGVCLICHGRSQSRAIKNAIRVAGEYAASNANRRIEEELLQWGTAGLAAVAE